LLVTDVHTSPHKKRNGRKITRVEAIFARTPDMPKIIITINEYGQPIGNNYRQLVSVIGCLVRKRLSVCCYDWRLIDIEAKDVVWDEVKVNLQLVLLLLLFICFVALGYSYIYALKRSLVLYRPLLVWSSKLHSRMTPNECLASIL
jgi:hypothetical protein